MVTVTFYYHNKAKIKILIQYDKQMEDFLSMEKFFPFLVVTQNTDGTFGNLLDKDFFFNLMDCFLY